MLEWITIKGLLFLDGIAICIVGWLLYGRLRGIIISDNKVIDAKLGHILETQNKIVTFLNNK